jgi:diguanylate cyclase (GGDEF)-like protein
VTELPPRPTLEVRTAPCAVEPLDALLDRADELLQTEPRQADALARSVLRQATGASKDALSLKARALELLANCEYHHAHYPQVIDAVEQALPILRFLGQQREIAAIKVTLGQAQRCLGAYPEALEQFMHALDLARKLGLPAIEARAQHATGMVYSEIDEPRQALEYFRQALDDYRTLGDQSGESHALSNISSCLQRISPLDEAQEREVLASAQQALALYRGLGLGRDEANLSATLGGAWRHHGNLKESLRVLDQAIGLAELRSQAQFLADAQLERAQTLMALGLSDAALAALDQARDAAQQVEARPYLARIHALLSGLAETVGDYARALDHMKRSHAAREAISNELKGVRMAFVQSRFEILSAKRDAERSQLKSTELEREVAARTAELKAEAERREIAQRELREAVYVDRLTGFDSRLALIERIEQRLKQLRDEAQLPFAVLFIDVDRFRRFNASLGYARADRLIKLLADRLGTALSGDDELARVQADEFVVLLTDYANTTELRARVQRLLDQFNEPLVLDGTELYLSASAGLVLGSASYLRAEHLLLDADTAMKRAKVSGRKLEVFEAQMRQHASQQLTLERDLRAAVSQRELKAYYQPIVDLASGRLSGFEALVRWPHRSRGLLAPALFLPVAEQMGLMPDLDQLVMSTALEQLKRWRSRYPAAHALTMNVNLTARHLQSEAHLDRVLEMLEDFDLPRTALKLEITETSLVDLDPAQLKRLTDLRDQGLRWVIDDFGTGYSSLSYLQRLPLNTLKIDRSFVRGLLDHSKDAQIVDMMARLAEALGLRIVAEGVEEEAQAQRLRELGCHDGQGFLYAAPLEPEQADAWVAAL